MELDRKNIRKAIREKEDLDYFIERVKEDGLDYINIKDLKKIRDQIERDISDFNKKQESECSVLKINNIIRIDTSDGISYTRRNYYKIINVEISYIDYDLITVMMSEFGNEIKVVLKATERRKDWIKKYNENYHEDYVDLAEWYKLLEYSKKIPWDKD